MFSLIFHMKDDNEKLLKIEDSKISFHYGDAINKNNELVIGANEYLTDLNKLWQQIKDIKTNDIASIKLLDANDIIFASFDQEIEDIVYNINFFNELQENSIVESINVNFR